MSLTQGFPNFFACDPFNLLKISATLHRKNNNTLSSVFVVIIQWQEIISRHWFPKPTNLLVGTKRKHIKYDG